MRFFAIFLLVCSIFRSVRSIRDVSLAQLEYVANHMTQTECRQLVSSLKSSSHDVDPRLLEQGLALPATTPCIQLLMTWGEGKDEVLLQLVRRLQQLHHPEVSDWLSTTTFQKLEADLRRSFAPRKCKCRPRINATNVSVRPAHKTVASAAELPTVEVKKKKKEKEEVVESNSKILDGLKKMHLPDHNLVKGLVLGVAVLASVLLVLVCIRRFVQWCLKWRNRQRGYRDLEFRFEDKDAPRDLAPPDFNKEFKKYCRTGCR